AQPPEANRNTLPLEFCYTFDVRDLPPGRVDLVVEGPEHFQITLNGTQIDRESDAGWWVDKSQRRLELPAGAPRVGPNCLRLICPRFNNSVNLETVFILGDFGVKVKGLVSTIVEAPRELRTGDWVRQSLPFYCASVVYHARVNARLRRGERAVLSLPEWGGTCAVIRVDGKEVGTVAWPPYEIDVTDALAACPPKPTDGTSRRRWVDLGIEIISSRRNAFGPLHLPQGKRGGEGFRRFRAEGKRWAERYNLKPCGLLTRPVLTVVR
ncbi:MAG: hypothetical protein QGD94_11990, partial [Planctomycetia bacterium]|nr:hypothetical protein [Planctomycetia bacterium]